MLKGRRNRLSPILGHGIEEEKRERSRPRAKGLQKVAKKVLGARVPRQYLFIGNSQILGPFS